jgi:hypothetical protein
MRRDRLIRRLFDAGSPFRTRTAMHSRFAAGVGSPEREPGAVEKTQLNPMMSLQDSTRASGAQRSLHERAAM